MKTIFLSLCTYIITSISYAQGVNNGHKYVDLGLSVKWATCNVGATKAEGYGGYYAWGETITKREYYWENYKFLNMRKEVYTKYITKEGLYRGTPDNKKKLDKVDDVAHVKWGGSWRMPTKEEQDELREKCTWTWTSLNGIRGYRVTSNLKGFENRSIFLPACGHKMRDEAIEVGIVGEYWSSINDTSDDIFMLRFDQEEYSWAYTTRLAGRPVRAVCP